MCIRDRLFTPGESRSLAGLLQDSVGANRWLVALEDGARAVVGSRIRRWVQARRDVDVDTFAWARILQCEAGADMTIAPASGGEPVVLGRVTAVLPLEVQEEA